MKKYSSREWGIFIAYVLIGGFAFVLRAYLATIAYPAQLDVPAIVAQGVKWVQGHPGGMGSVWPEIPILIAGTAYRNGLDPARVLQCANVLYGSMIVVMSMLLAYRLFNRHAIAWITGVLTAANGGMLAYATNSMPETGYSMLLVSAFALMAFSIRGAPISTVAVCVSYSLLAVSIYFRPLESLLSLIMLTGWLFITHLSQWKKTILQLVPALLCATCVVLPYYIKAHSANVGGDRLSGNLRSIAFGELAYNGGFFQDPDRDQYKQQLTQEVFDLGLPRWLWVHRSEVSQRYFNNLLRSARIYSEYLFTNAFRLGNGWFIALMAVVIWTAMRGVFWKENLFLALMLTFLPAGLSLGYIFSRYLLSFLPLLIIMMAAFVVNQPLLWNSRTSRWFWSLLMLVMILQSSVTTVQIHKDRMWKWQNLHEMAGMVRSMVPENGRIIAPQDEMIVEFDLDHPDRWVKLPFSKPDRFEKFAAKHRVTHIVLCTSEKSHFPIYALFEGEPPPPNWSLVLEKKYEREHPVWGHQEETYRVYNRIDIPVNE